MTIRRKIITLFGDRADSIRRKQRSGTVRSNIRIFVLAIVAVAAASLAEARAQDMRVDRLELREAGFYDVAKATVTGTTQAAGTVTGAVQELRDVTLSPQPPATSARVGVGFGVRFRSFGARDGERAMLRSVWKIPAPGIVNPNDGKTYLESAADFATTIGSNHLRGYTFEQPWEIVPGTWTLEIWQGDRKLLEKSFEVRKSE
jgi:hypothetical protein